MPFGSDPVDKDGRGRPFTHPLVNRWADLHEGFPVLFKKSRICRFAKSQYFQHALLLQGIDAHGKKPLGLEKVDIGKAEFGLDLTQFFSTAASSESLKTISGTQSFVPDTSLERKVL